MKKTVAFILAFMYLGLTSGLAVNIHYCMGKVTEVQLDSYKEAPCECSKKTPMPCCNHQYEIVKVNDAHQQVAADFQFKTPELTLHTFSQLMALLTMPQTQQQATVTDHAPPLLTPPDIYIQNCVFRI